MTETTHEARCRRMDGIRVTQRHQRDCNASGCEGCEPCQRDHCRCGRHLRDHEPLTCARCVGRTRTKLQRIRDLCTLAPHADHAIGSGVYHLTGPLPEISTYEARRAWVHAGGLCQCPSKGRECPDWFATLGPACEDCQHPSCLRAQQLTACPDALGWLDTATDERHPLWVLGTWDMMTAEHLDHDRRLRVTVPSAAAYLDGSLTYLAQDATFPFDQLERDLSTCLRYVEEVMAVAPYVQKGAPCPMCGKASLEKRFGDDEDHDRWECPRCRQWWTEGDYRLKVSGIYAGVAEALTADQIERAYRVPASTVRRWASGWTSHGVWHEPVVARRGRDGDGRQLYDVADVKRFRDESAA